MNSNGRTGMNLRHHRRMRLLWWSAAVVLAGLLLAGCKGPEVDLSERMRTALTAPAAVADWIIQGRNNFVLIDLRGKDDFARGSLPGAMHVESASLARRDVLNALPGHKRLVFFTSTGEPSVDLLRPVFQSGRHVLILQGGISGWEEQVLKVDATVRNEQDARRLAVSRYFRGESALGTPQPLEEIKAEEFLRKPGLRIKQPSDEEQASEGC